MNQTSTWILVADARRARLFRQSGFTASGLEPVLPGDWVNNMMLQAHDSPASAETESSGAARHIDLRDRLKQSFARTITEYLEKAHQQGAFSGLIIFAAPAMLTALHDAFSLDLLDSVIVAVEKNMTAARRRDIAGMVARLIPPPAEGDDLLPRAG